MQQAKCNIEYDEGILVISVSGDIDHHSAKPLREEIDTNLYLYRAKTVIMDLSGVSFMDSSGLGLILGRYSRVNDLEGRMIIANPDESVSKILALAGTDRLITIKRTDETASHRYFNTEVKRG
ncbi:MAG: anti-sigma factor antagonist [Clostridia bacterium]|nr:anti-sigma factor antagonist [Clostridia bacterium]